LVKLDFDLYAAYCRGYLEAVGPSLTAEELRSLPWGARVITLETGIRFLTDFLDGDHYFKTSYPEHNLIRARTQFKLVRDMEAQWDDLCAVINSRLRAIPLGADN
ncbi:MAG: mucin desulfatase, partial [Oscillospiraceae bacterium]|nr:mucin desulfatase [Oscillospiraceae bacterium]